MHPVTAALIVFWLSVLSMAFLSLIGAFGTPTCAFNAGQLACNGGPTYGEVFGVAALSAATAGLAEWPGIRRGSQRN